jgi:SAM-dependent methyltransferase
MILDLGCGHGQFSNYLSKTKNVTVFGVDIDAGNIERCKRNAISTNQKFLIAEGKQLPFEDHFFDEIHAYEVLEHVDDLNSVMAELRRVLKKGGMLHISVPLGASERILLRHNPDYFNQVGHRRFFDKIDLMNLVEKYDFSAISYKTSNAAEHLFWKTIFKGGEKIIDQTGAIDHPKPMTSLMLKVTCCLSDDLFFRLHSHKSPLKKLSLIVGYPIGKILDQFLLNKKQCVVCQSSDGPRL